MPAGKNGAVPINCYALVTYIPGSLGAFFDDLRRELVPDCSPRAHVTILPPRPLATSAACAVEELNTRLSELPTFEIEAAQLEIFQTTSVIYVSLGNGRSDLERIHKVLNTGSLEFAEPFSYHPHITVVQDLAPERVPELFERAKQRWAEFKDERSFAVDTITFVQNTNMNRWLDLAHWSLGAVPSVR